MFRLRVLTPNFQCGWSCVLTIFGQNAQFENAFDTILELYKMPKCSWHVHSVQLFKFCPILSNRSENFSFQAVVWQNGTKFEQPHWMDLSTAFWGLLRFQDCIKRVFRLCVLTKNCQNAASTALKIWGQNAQSEHRHSHCQLIYMNLNKFAVVLFH